MWFEKNKHSIKVLLTNENKWQQANAKNSQQGKATTLIEYEINVKDKQIKNKQNKNTLKLDLNAGAKNKQLVLILINEVTVVQLKLV